MKLFIFDFDHTIVDGNTHNAINRSRANRGIEQEYVNSPWEVVHEFSTIGSESDWKEIFENLYQQGHFLSIASFNAYELIIPQFLRKIGLSEELIAEIHIIAGLPENPRTANKNGYIQEAIQYVENYCQHYQYTDGEPLQVIFIDDSKKNIEAAKELGCTTILAKPDGSHLKQLLENYIAPPVNRHLKPQANQAPTEAEWSTPFQVAQNEMSLDQWSENTIAPPANRQLKPLTVQPIPQAQAEYGWEIIEQAQCLSISSNTRQGFPLNQVPPINSFRNRFFSQQTIARADAGENEADQLMQNLTYRQ